MKWFIQTLVQTYRCWEPVEKLILTVKSWVQKFIPPFMTEMVHIGVHSGTQTFYKRSCFVFKQKKLLEETPYLFIFRLWNPETLRTEHYCLSKEQVKRAFGFTNDVTLYYLVQFESSYLVSTILNHVHHLQRASVLSVMPNKTYSRELERYKTTVFANNNLNVFQVCCLTAFASRKPLPQKTHLCQATIIDEQLKETIKYNDEMLF